MNLLRPAFILPALGGLVLLLPGCVVPVETAGPETHTTVRRDVYVNEPPATTTEYELTLGDGYAGRGYYYGPPNTRYFRREHGVTYYRTREAAPREYWDRPHGSRHEYQERSHRPRYEYQPERVSSTRFSVVLGDGYAGRGYYYGPAGTTYFRESPDVRYYRTRELVPSEYWR